MTNELHPGEVLTAETVGPERRFLKAGFALLNRAEVQSGSDRQSWAEGLIRQLPVDHDGRNSWLLNFGESEEAKERRENWNAEAVKDGRAPTCKWDNVTRSAGRAFLSASDEGRGSLPAAPSVPTCALDDIAAERLRQVHQEGWTAEHDDRRGDGSLAVAAACYAMFASVSDKARAATTLSKGLTTKGKDIPGWSAWLEIWPWDRSWWKPKDRRRDLVRAGALIVAEIERLDRKGASS